MLTTRALERQHDDLIRDTLISLPSDDWHWVKPRRGEFKHEQRYKRNKEEPEEKDVTSYHVFGLGWRSDVKYNRKLIKVMNKAINDNQEDVYEQNRHQIKTFAEAVMKLEMRYLGL